VADKAPKEPKDHAKGGDKGDKVDKAAKAAAAKAKADKAAPKVEAAAGKPAGPPPPVRLYLKYRDEIVPALAKKFGRTNPHSVPKLQKICVNMGVGKTLQDKNRLEQAAADLTMISGQKAQITKSRVAISGFRLRENNEIGCRVTLRGKRMYEFLDRLISTALPRIRDFRGINPNSFDGSGNYTFGVSEQGIFAEVDADKINFTQGMDITIVTSGHSDDEARELLKLFGMPFREN
jgi:large subunit ribosomal protein L5